MPPALQAFLDQCRKSNLPLAQVLTGLKNAGWTEEHINLARQYYSPGIPPPPSPYSSIPPTRMTPKKSSFPIILSIIFLFFILFSGLGVSAYFVAVEKIPLSNWPLKKVITSAVFRIPFIPKTPRYLLGETVVAHEKLSRNSFDLSLAASSNDFQSVLGVNQLDLQLAGFTDFSNTKNPKFSLDLNWSRELSVHALKSDKLIYFKIDKLPLFVTAYLGIDSARLAPALANWVVYDPTPLETEARKSISSPSDIDSPINQTTRDLISKMLDEEILPLIKVSSDRIDSNPAYKLTYQPSATQLDRVYTKFSQGLGAAGTLPKSDISLKSTSLLPSHYIKNFLVTVWVDQQQYYIRKVVISFTYHPDNAVSAVPVSDASVALALKLSDFGKNIPVTPPAAAITPEEYMALIQKLSPQINRQQAAAESTKFQADLMQLAAAVEMYRADHKGNLPANLSLLVPEYISRLPNSVVEQSVAFKTDRTKKEYLIYSKKPDPEDSQRPFRGWDSVSRTYTRYSQKDINNF